MTGNYRLDEDFSLEGCCRVRHVDIAMPKLSGWEVARRIRERYGSKRGPLLIGISGQYKQAVDKILADIIGFDHYLTKRHEPSDVLRLIAPLRYPTELRDK